MSARRLRAVLIAVGVVLVAYWAAAATGWPVQLRGPLNPYGWNWPMLRVRHDAVVVVLVAIAAAAALFAVARPRSRFRRARLLLLPVVSVTLMLSFFAVKSGRPVELLVHRCDNGLFLGHIQTARVASFHDLTAGYPKFHEHVCFHCEMHPPGTMLFHWVLLRVADHVPGAEHVAAFLMRALAVRGFAPDAYFLGLFLGAFAILICGALTPLVVRRIALLDADEETAFLVAAAAAFAPGLVLMAPEFDQVEIVPPLVAYWLALRSVDFARPVHAFFAGVALAVGTWLTFLVAAYGLPLALVWFCRRGFDWRRGLKLAAVGFAGWLAFYVALYATTGANLVAVWQAVSHSYFGHPTNLGRSYWRFFAYNPLDFANFAGAPCVLFALAGLATRHASRLHTIAALAVVLALDLLGVQRGEVGRTWICFMPLLQLGALALCTTPSLARLLFGLQALGTVIIGMSWNVP